MEKNTILEMVKGILLPKEIAEHFDLSDIKEYKAYIIIELREKTGLIPKATQKKAELVLDGFLNPIELQSFPLRGKAVYIKIYRRKWKDKGGGETYWNQYDFNPEGVKATKEFASFLKGAYGQTPEQYNNDRESIMR